MTQPTPSRPTRSSTSCWSAIIDVPAELVWKAWTTPEHLKHWFCPKPWTVTDCEIDLRPGGIFRTVMRSPEGQEFPNVGCYLEVMPNERLVFTDTLLPGFRPSPEPFFTAALQLDRTARHALHAIAIHGNEESAQEARGDGLPRRLGHGGRPDGRPYQGTVSASSAAQTVNIKNRGYNTARHRGYAGNSAHERRHDRHIMGAGDWLRPDRRALFCVLGFHHDRPGAIGNNDGGSGDECHQCGDTQVRVHAAILRDVVGRADRCTNRVLIWNKLTALLVVAGALVYFVGMTVVTIACNVPLNNRLAATDPTSSDAETIWTHYRVRWTMWNHVRTVASTLACIAFVAALRIR